MFKHALVAAFFATTCLAAGDANAGQLSCSSPDTLAALQGQLDAMLAPFNNQAAYEQALVKAVQQSTQAVSFSEELIKNEGWDAVTRARYEHEIAGLEKAQCIVPQPPPEAPPPDTRSYADVLAAEGRDAAAAWSAARARAGAHAYENGTRPADLAAKYHYAQLDFQACQDSRTGRINDLKRQYQDRAQQTLAGTRRQLIVAEDQLAKTTADAQVPFQPIVAIPEDIVTTGQTDFQTTCESNITLHHGTQHPGSMGLAYRVTQTDAGKIIVTQSGLTALKFCEVLPGKGC